MCGIVGYISKLEAQHSMDVLLSMVNSLEHRGPDDFGLWLNKNKTVGLGHRRLAIVELSKAGSQPMSSLDSRFTIIFNGEIYNNSELRKLLKSKGYDINWRGYSDTETILNCFIHFGFKQTLQLIVGMFALALWDDRDQVLNIARDKFGEKPIYWGWQNQNFIFGSELKALKKYPMFIGKINRNAISLLLRFNYIPAPHSIYEGISKLLPGHFISVPCGKGQNEVRPEQYWSMSTAIEKSKKSLFTGSEVEAVNILENKLCKAISGQMLADVPLGAFLSGGIDSSLVVALMQKQSFKRIQTFTIGFHEKGFDESGHADAVSRHLGTSHTEFQVSSRNALEIIPKLPMIYCEPFADSSQIPTYFLSQLASQSVTVALSGDVGDELFAGYEAYRSVPQMWKVISALPLPVRVCLQNLLAGLPLRDRLYKLCQVMASSSFHDFYRNVRSHTLHPEMFVLESNEPDSLLSNPSCWPNLEFFSELMMAVDMQTYIPDDILVKVDRAAMANGLETRLPLLDPDVFEFAWSLPINMKIRNGFGKWALRKVLYRHVPRELIDRPKQGFSLPIATWLREGLREWAEDLLSEQRLNKDGYLCTHRIRKVWLAHLKGDMDYSSILWSILMFQAWLKDQHE